MLQAFDLSYSPDPRAAPLFTHIDLAIAPGDKIALVGRNGCGKTSIARILAGELQPTSGRVVASSDCTVGYLPQDFGSTWDGSLAEVIESLAPSAAPHEVFRTLHRLELGVELMHRQFTQLSLGERTRGVLAALLSTRPSILILDEPTNHLDLQTRMWFESFLRAAPEAVLIISHDRATVNAVATQVLELSERGLEEFAGGYDDMLAAKRTQHDRAQASWETHKAEVRRLQNAAEATAQRAAKTSGKPKNLSNYSPMAKPFFGAKQARMDRVAKSMLERAARVRERAPDKPYVGDDVKLTFPTRRLRSSFALVARQLRKHYGERKLFDGIDITLEAGDRLAIIGPNGAGKSTLLNILTGNLEADSGAVEWASDASVAVLSQARDVLDCNLSAAEVVATPDGAGRTTLASLGMRGVVADRRIGDLSMGERTKVEIVAMMLAGANVLVLDEPTNHMDLQSVEALEAALRDYTGAVIFTSHDRHFVDAIATAKLVLGG